MKITSSDVEHVAGLARLRLSSEETEKLLSQLDSILGYMDLLAEADTEGVSPTHHSSSLVNALRPDEIRESQGLSDALLNAPEQKDGYIVVPKVIE